MKKGPSRVLSQFIKDQERMFLIQAFLLSGLIVYLGSVHISLLQAPISRDAGAFMTMAAEIHRGSLPYADYIDHKPPGVYYFLAGVFLISETAIAAKTSILLVNFVTAGLILVVGRQIWSSIEGMVAAGLYLAALPLYSGYHVLTGQLVAITSVGALYLFILYRESSERHWLSAAGLVAGCAPLFKQPALVTPALLIGVLVLDEFPRSGPRGLRRIIGFSIAAITPIAVTVIYFVLAGAGQEFIFWTLTVNIEYGGLFTIEENINRHIKSISDFRALWYLGGLGAIVAILQSVRTKCLDSPLIIALLLIGSASPLFLGPYAHYLIQPLPFAALALVYLIVESASVMEQTISTDYAIPLLLAGLFIMSVPAAGAVTNTESRITGFGLDDQEMIAESVSNETDDGRLLVITAEPAMYFLTGHSPYDENLYYLPANRNVSFSEDELVAQLKNDPPKYVLARQCQRVEAICEHVRSEYNQIGVYERGFTLFGRSDAT